MSSVIHNNCCLRALSIGCFSLEIAWKERKEERTSMQQNLSCIPRGGGALFKNDILTLSAILDRHVKKIDQNADKVEHKKPHCCCLNPQQRVLIYTKRSAFVPSARLFDSVYSSNTKNRKIIALGVSPTAWEEASRRMGLQSSLRLAVTECSSNGTQRLSSPVNRRAGR